MNIWLLHVGEELPVDPNPRLFRYGYLAEALAQRGHQVLRWAPTFQHARKVQRFDSDQRVTIAPGYDIQFVYADGYRRNISWARYRSYQTLARRFEQLASDETAPDLIVSGIPSPAWCAAALRYAEPQNIPVVVDVRDLWPDIFLTAIPSSARWLARPALSPLFAQAKSICKRSTGITGVSQAYVDWGLRNARRPATAADRVIPLGYQEHEFAPRELADKIAWLKTQGVDPSKTIACFFGLFEKSYDLDCLIETARHLQAQGRTDLQFVLCGRGSKESSVRSAAEVLNNVVLLGWVDPATIAAVMRLASIGLATYASDALQSLPNKPFEYMAGGLAVVSSLRGELAQLLDQHGCGVTYPAGHSLALAKCLEQLMDAPKRLCQMRESAYRAFKTSFRAETLAHQMVDHLESIVGSSSEEVLAA